MQKNIEQIFKEAKKYARSLLKKKAVNTADFPTIGGVYLIKNKKGDVIYIGKGENLKKRIKDHISGMKSLGKSTFRRKIARIHNIEPGPEMRKWVIENCKFVYKRIDDPDMRSLVEDLLITYLRNTKKLLND